jgi:hypothetical protein
MFLILSSGTVLAIIKKLSAISHQLSALRSAGFAER